jgi:hypothetical protein
MDSRAGLCSHPNDDLIETAPQAGKHPAGLCQVPQWFPFPLTVRSVSPLSAYGTFRRFSTQLEL